jgi:integrase
MDLHDLARSYHSNHDCELSTGYLDNLLNVARLADKFAGRKVQAKELTSEFCNDLLRWLRANGRSDGTIRSRRTDLLILGKYAARLRLLEKRPKIKRFKLRQAPPKTWAEPEIRKIFDACAKLEGTLPNGISQRWYFASLFACLYSTGIRLGDALSLKPAQINANHIATITCSKTGRPVSRQLDAVAVQFMLEAGCLDRAVCWPLWGISSGRSSRRNLYRRVSIIVKSAGLSGTARYFRRAAATHVAETLGVDAARRLLDHRSVTTTLNHYLDQTQLTPVAGPQLSSLLGLTPPGESLH